MNKNISLLRDIFNSIDFKNNLIRKTKNNNFYWDNYFSAMEKINLHIPYKMNFINAADVKKTGCKIGLEMAVLSNKIKIHFLLDEINLEEVIEKINRTMSITGSELRYAYRHRERLKGNIYFYQNGKEVDAPWVQDSASWSKYIPKSSRQH